jgi:hypothetical protein
MIRRATKLRPGGDVRIHHRAGREVCDRYAGREIYNLPRLFSFTVTYADCKGFTIEFQEIIRAMFFG